MLEREEIHLPHLSQKDLYDVFKKHFGIKYPKRRICVNFLLALYLENERRNIKVRKVAMFQNRTTCKLRDVMNDGRSSDELFVQTQAPFHINISVMHSCKIK